jgi:hypothetical protein
MIDITPALESFISRKQDWQRESSVRVADAIADELAAKLTWDEGSGEDWSRVLLAGQAGVMISMAGPLVVTSVDVALRVSAVACDVPVITVPSLDARVLVCDAHTLRAAFGDQVWNNPALNAERFSADELWFCTI